MNVSEYQRYIDIGRRNEDVIRLLRNWCSHAQIEVFGGIGLIEAQTGLPIAHRHIRCKHQRAGGMSSMNMEDNVLDFHDRNCFDCRHRDPVGLPNISGLVGERDRERRASTKRREAEAEEDARKLSERRRELRACREGASQSQLALLNLIESVDQDPTNDAVETLLEGIAAAPEAGASSSISRALEVLHSGAGRERTQGALAALYQLPYSRQDLVELSLVALSRGDSVDIALEIVADHLQEESDQLAAAIPALVWRCLPKSRSRFDSDVPPPKPRAIVRCNQVAPEITASRLREALRADSKEARRAASLAIRSTLRGGDGQTYLALLPDLVSSFSLRAEPVNPNETVAFIS